MESSRKRSGTYPIYNIYINDLPDVQNIAKLFADDTKLYAVMKEEEQQISLQNDIDSLLKWSDRWFKILKFNKSKCKHVRLRPNANIKYKMGESEIQQVTEEKDLGIIIDDKLKFKQHINQQTKKANQRLGMIKRSFDFMDKILLSNQGPSKGQSHYSDLYYTKNNKHSNT